MRHNPYHNVRVIIVSTVLLERQEKTVIVKPIRTLNTGFVEAILLRVSQRCLLPHLPILVVRNDALDVGLDPIVHFVELNQEMVEPFLVWHVLQLDRLLFEIRDKLLL